MGIMKGFPKDYKVRPRIMRITKVRDYEDYKGIPGLLLTVISQSESSPMECMFNLGVSSRLGVICVSFVYKSEALKLMRITKVLLRIMRITRIMGITKGIPKDYKVRPRIMRITKVRDYEDYKGIPWITTYSYFTIRIFTNGMYVQFGSLQWSRTHQCFIFYIIHKFTFHFKRLLDCFIL